MSRSRASRARVQFLQCACPQRVRLLPDSERTKASFDLFSFSAVSVKIKRPRALLALKAFSRKCQTEKAAPAAWEAPPGPVAGRAQGEHEGTYQAMVAHAHRGRHIGSRFSWCDAPYRHYKSFADFAREKDDADGL